LQVRQVSRETALDVVVDLLDPTGTQQLPQR
jgi:hypothetical protein